MHGVIHPTLGPTYLVVSVLDKCSLLVPASSKMADHPSLINTLNINKDGDVWRDVSYGEISVLSNAFRTFYFCTPTIDSMTRTHALDMTS